MFWIHLSPFARPVISIPSSWHTVLSAPLQSCKKSCPQSHLWLCLLPQRLGWWFHSGSNRVIALMGSSTWLRLHSFCFLPGNCMPLCVANPGSWCTVTNLGWVYLPFFLTKSVFSPNCVTPWNNSADYTMRAFLMLSLLNNLGGAAVTLS